MEGMQAEERIITTNREAINLLALIKLRRCSHKEDRGALPETGKIVSQRMSQVNRRRARSAGIKCRALIYVAFDDRPDLCAASLKVAFPQVVWKLLEVQEDDNDEDAEEDE